MSLALYTFADNVRHALENVHVDEETGEVVGFEELDQWDVKFEEKALKCAAHANEMTAELKALEAEQKQIKDKQDKLAKKLESFKTYIASCMDAAGKSNVQGARFTLSFKKTPRTVIDDESKLPTEYVKEKITKTPDKLKIKAAITDGKTVIGAHIEFNRNLQIR